MITSKSMQINGEYIETLIEGYTTISVTGQEMLGVDQKTEEIGISDGSVFKYKRYEERTLKVSFAIEGKTRQELMQKLVKLNGILSVTNAELIFNDEPDVYYIGTIDGSPEAGISMGVATDNGVAAGSFTFLCADPFKYSVAEHEAMQSIDDPKTVFVDYQGSYKAYPVLEVDFYKEEDSGTALSRDGDCGFVAFFNEDEKIIQVGDPEEADGVAKYEKSQTLINQTFTESSSWTSVQSLWSKNAGSTYLEAVTRAGSIGMGISTYAVPSNPTNTSGTVLSWARSDYGSPYIYYTVSLTAYGRTANSVYVKAVVTSSLKSGSWFYNGYGLMGSLYIGGSWHNVTLKRTSDRWKGACSNSASMTFTVSGLSESTASLTGIQFKVSRTDGYDSSGIMNARACSNLRISTYEASVPDTYYLAPTSYGSGTNYHGPSISRALPADSTGAIGAKDFTFTYAHKMSMGNGNSYISQIGGFQSVLIAGSTVLGGIRVLKNSDGKNGTLKYYIKDKAVYSRDIDLTYKNSTFGNGGNVIITKAGSQMTFSIGNDTQTFTDETIKDTVVTQIAFIFEQYSSINALSYNGLSWVKFVKNNCDVYENVPNKFGSNDVLICNCRNGDILLNDVSQPKLGSLGNNWESFYLKPGLNQIGFAYSDWVTDEHAPTLKVKYREVFI